MNIVDKKLNEIIDIYNNFITKIDNKATNDSSRAYGGIIRAGKGSLVEGIARSLVRIAWQNILNQNGDRMEINKKKIPIYINEGYIKRISDDDIKEYVEAHKKKFVYKFGTDVQVFVDGSLVLPIECKAYAENAMLKRILFDAKLMKTAKGINTYYLVQLESQLGGDYSELNDTTHGSPATHALMSYVDVELKIITLLKGERRVDRPIHKPEYFKELKISELKKAVNIFAEDLEKYAE